MQLNFRHFYKDCGFDHHLMGSTDDRLPRTSRQKFEFEIKLELETLKLAQSEKELEIENPILQSNSN